MQQQSNFIQTDKIAILGRSGSGKSFLAQKIASVYPRLFIFDTLYEYSNNGETVHTFEDFSENLIRNENSQEFVTVIQFDIEDSGNTQEFNEMLRCIYYRGNCTIFIDEIQNFSNVHQMPDWLRKTCLTGRHRQIGLIYTTQRPGELHKTILSQASKVFCGNLHTLSDIRTMSNYLGKSDNEISELPDRKFIYWIPGQPTKLINNDLTDQQSIPETEQVTEEQETEEW